MKTTELLKKLEWSGWRDTAPMYMGGPPMSQLPCCPRCGGVKPSKHAEFEFTPDAIGHKKKCELAKALKEATK